MGREGQDRERAHLSLLLGVDLLKSEDLHLLPLDGLF
jgi:hypothetical protein